MKLTLKDLHHITPLIWVCSTSLQQGLLIKQIDTLERDPYYQACLFNKYDADEEMNLGFYESREAVIEMVNKMIEAENIVRGLA